MKVCMVSPRYPPNIHGGGERSCSLLVQNLSRHVDIEVVSFDGNVTGESMVNGVHVIRKKVPLSFLKSEVNFFAYNFLKKKIKNYDVFHTYNNDLLPVVGVLSKKFDIKSVGTINGVTFLSRDFGVTLGNFYASVFGGVPDNSIINPFFLRNKVALSAMRSISRFTVLCPFSKEELIRNGLPSEKISVIPNMLDPGFKPIIRDKKGNGTVKILYIANLYYSKSIDMLIKAYARLKKQNIELLIAGKNIENIQILIEKIKPVNKVNLIGEIAYKDVPVLFAGSDIFIQPYKYPEPIGRTLLEALACGVCTITTGNDNYSPIIKDGIHGVLIYPNSPEKLSEKVQMLIDNPQLRDKLGRNGRQQVYDICSPQKIAQQYIKIYKELAK